MKRGLLLAAAAVAIAVGTASGQAASRSGIVFAADRAPSLTGEIYRLDPNGHRVDLSRSPYQDTNPAVSFDGRKVAFLSDRSGRTSLYEVGIDGRGLVRLGLSLPPPSQDDCVPDPAWQPHGTTLAVAACGSSKGWLWIVRPGHKPLEVLSGKSSVQGPYWSPDGHMLVAWNSLGTLHAISPDGHTLWTGRASGFSAAWSRGGLLAVPARHGAAVYDESGQLRFHFELPSQYGGRFAWSPDGRDLAVSWLGSSYKLEVRTADGKLVLARRVPGGDMAWAGNSKVVFGTPDCPTCSTTEIDVRTGKLSPASQRWLDPLSADRRLAIVIPPAKDGAPFALGAALTAGGAVKQYARIDGCFSDQEWSPAASSLQFVGRTRSLVYESWSDCDPPFANLYSISSGGGRVTRLTNVQAQETQPALSPDGSEIAYVWAQANGMSCSGCSDGIRLASADGTAIRTLTDPPDCTFDDSPAWSPDGSTILYSQTSCDNNGELYTIPAAGGTPHDLGIVGQSPAWGPSRIAYDGANQSDPGLWTANPDGSDRMLVDRHGGIPAWSPDGRLAYLEGTFNRYVVVGSKRVRLPFSEATSLAWSADGSRLVVTARAPNTATFDVYTVKADGTDPVRLTRNYDALGAHWGG